MAEQTSQVALKALIIFYKKRNVGEHSIQELVRISSEYDKRFEDLVEAGKILDRLSMLKFFTCFRHPNKLGSESAHTSPLSKNYEGFFYKNLSRIPRHLGRG